MEIQDRSPIAEEFIFQLWEKKYFATLELITDQNLPIQIVSIGNRNMDSGPDFKDITIKIQDQIYHGDLEIHRSDNDWYLHGHHHDSAYNRVILHLVIGRKSLDKPILRLNQQPVMAQVYVDLSENQIKQLIQTYQLAFPPYNATSLCQIADQKTASQKLAFIEHAGITRFYMKAARFKEERLFYSWDQIIYTGFMEALGYSKNQRPFRKLAQLLPIEVIFSELRHGRDSLIKIQSLLFGVAGLLPSQDPKLLIRDEESIQYINQLEEIWAMIRSKLGIESMKKEEWQFFRLRPINFPTRRLAAASYMLPRFASSGLLETFVRLIFGLSHNIEKIFPEIEALFICSVEGFWADHYLLGEQGFGGRSPNLVGSDRARDIVVNVVLPSLYAYAEETEDGQLKNTTLQIYRQYPKLATNQIIRDMFNVLKLNAWGKINTALKQQGLIHLYKMYCKNKDCTRCAKFINEEILK